MVPIRRCNLSCTYCNEYDDHSPPVPTDVMLRRADKLAELGTSIVTLSGGEPLLHPDFEEIVARIASHGIVPELLTNAYLLTPQRIQGLNEAGLGRLQISVDNVKPDETSKKSLKVLDSKLRMLAEHAEFQINVNSVLGSAIENPQDALIIARRARELGFTTTVGILHDVDGSLKPLNEEQRQVYEQVSQLSGRSFGPFVRFKDNLARGKPNQWRCRAGARYLYICEDGLVHYCSQQRGHPGVPLLDYTREDLAREFDREKPCAPYCTIGCVHAVALFDNWRRPQRTVALPTPDPTPPGTTTPLQGPSLAPTKE
jgi:MoaA/NifB/PqqE/SkfB family radical SAM enzyme